MYSREMKTKKRLGPKGNFFFFFFEWQKNEQDAINYLHRRYAVMMMFPQLLVIFAYVFFVPSLVKLSPPYDSQHPAPSPKIWPYLPLKSLPLGHKSFSEGRSLGASAERGATHGDLCLATGDGGGAQGCCALPAGDRRVSHHDLGLVSLD